MNILAVQTGLDGFKKDQRSTHRCVDLGTAEGREAMTTYSV